MPWLKIADTVVEDAATNLYNGPANAQLFNNVHNVLYYIAPTCFGAVESSSQSS